MSANEIVSGAQLVRLPRTDRERARPEDFEMIERTRAALALLDSKWSVDIILLLASGMHRHARLVDNIPGLSKKVLTATLRKLERNGSSRATSTRRSRCASNTRSPRSAGN